ncbi:MAG TPA: NAD(P)/FAD-dependent oxidoreductase [Streptosporangiaceae bacterium]|nr:NAD(P)/FAD-dependent oxidoreductase [Streptosporangiaceae bacterium]
MGAFDVVVLGGGTAGVHVATEVAGGGKSVALVEAGLIGGESPYLACLPSNSMLLSAARGKSWEDAVARRAEVTGGLDDSAAARRLRRAGVTVIRGTGRIIAPGTVEVTLAPGEESAPAGTVVPLAYADLVLATGCEPVAPPIEGLSDIPAWTTAESLCSPDLPRRLIVLGGGPAGCELTQIYASFGSQVTLVEADPGLLPGEPAFAGEILAAALRRAGAEIYLGSRATKAERTSDGLTLALADGTRIDADRLLLASGRRPRLGGLGLDVLGLEVTPGMALPTTTRCEVAGAGGRVWAAGDVTGTTHTHASQYQAGVVAANIGGQDREADYSAIPRCVFTTPSVFSVGIAPEAPGDGGTETMNGSGRGAPEAGEPTRRMLRIAKMPAEDRAVGPASAPESPAQSPRLVTARASLGDTTRAHLGQDDLGCLELYADAGSGVLVGAVAVGPDAASWMGEVTLAIRARIPVAILADVVHAFPTYGEALETALRELARTRGSAVMDNHQEEGIGPLSELDMPLSELDIETPENDAIEQHQELIADETAVSVRREVPFDVNEADAAEQDRAVGYDDDDYR